MSEVKVYNEKGSAQGTEKLDDFIFGQKSKQSVIHQVYISAMSNRRQKLAHAKDRSDVRGGGRKPWRQKGTGRARHGSIRSPLWSGGGVTFGPSVLRNFKKKINKKLNSLAVRMCFSDKVRAGKFLLLEKIENDGKTKTIVNLLEKLSVKGKTILFLVGSKDDNLMKALKNIPKVAVTRANDVNIVDLLHNQFIILDKAALKILNKRFKK